MRILLVVLALSAFSLLSASCQFGGNDARLDTLLLLENPAIEKQWVLYNDTTDERGITSFIWGAEEKQFVKRPQFLHIYFYPTPLSQKQLSERIEEFHNLTSQHDDGWQEILEQSERRTIIAHGALGEHSLVCFLCSPTDTIQITLRSKECLKPLEEKAWLQTLRAAKIYRKQ